MAASYVLDTAALLWWTLEPSKLSRAAKAACATIEKHGDGMISSISIWEIGVKVRSGKLDLGMPLGAYHRKLLDLGSLDIVPVDDLTWLRNLSLEWDHRDPADRTIVALALLRALPLVTSDREIAAFYSPTVW